MNVATRWTLNVITCSHIATQTFWKTVFPPVSIHSINLMSPHCLALGRASPFLLLLPFMKEGVHREYEVWSWFVEVEKCTEKIIFACLKRKKLGLSFNFKERACRIFLEAWSFTLGIKTKYQRILDKFLCHEFRRFSHTIEQDFGCWDNAKVEIQTISAGIFLLKISNRNIRKRCEICSKLTIMTP